MSFPIFGSPIRPPTHASLPPEAVFQIAQALQSAGAPLSRETIEGAAQNAEVPRSHAYVAAGMLHSATFEREHQHAFVVCSGGCQKYGALPLLEKLLDTRDARVDAGRTAFDVTTRGCLDGCARGPIVRLQTPDGVGGIPFATLDGLDEALALIDG